MSGFTRSGYPKSVPGAIAEQARREHDEGRDFGIELWTGASTAPELDGVLAEAGAVSKRLPFQSDPAMRKSINAGDTEYVDTHLSHSAQQAWFGFYGNLDVAVVEVAGIRPTVCWFPAVRSATRRPGSTWPTRSFSRSTPGTLRSYEGFHDVYYGTRRPPERLPIQLLEPMQRIGDPYLRVDPSKVVAVVETNAPDRNLPFKAADEDSKAIAFHLVDFLRHEIKADRLPPELLPLQSGVGNVANAVMGNLADSEFEGLTAYTEVIQDGMLDLIDNGKLASVSATAFSLSAERAATSTRTSSPTRGASSCARRRCRTIRKPSAASASLRSTEWSRPTSTAM